MKLINTITKAPALLLILVLGSCTDELDQVPVTDKESGNFYKTEIEIEEAVNGVYAALQSDGLYGLYLPAIGEIPSDNTFDEVPANDNGIYGQLDEFTVTPTNAIISEIWKDSYVAIQRANIVLNRIGQVEFSDETIKSARIGEMKFIRGLLYFNLVRLYGKVPLVVTEIIDPNELFGQGRSPEADIYNQIEIDLNEAVSELPSGILNGRVTKGAALAVLGKFYLTQGRYDEAKTQLEAVMNLNVYGLLPGLEDVFALENENSEEIIFSVQFASGVNGNSEGSRAFQHFSPSGTVSGAKGHNLPTRSLYTLYAPGDKRIGKYLDATGDGVPFCLKFKEPATQAEDGGSNFVVVRYADVLLMLSEVENEFNNTVLAANYLNQVRQRTGLPDTDAITQLEMRNAISLERRLELVGEGHRWFDLLRTDAAISTMNAWFQSEGISKSIDQVDLLMPVPQSQIDTDPAIAQNPGY
jgi:tetratricopeptide (TPR) repeat protein